VIEALRMLMEMARGPKVPKPKRAAVSRVRPRVTRTARRHAPKARRPRG
jgi:nicotinamide-nucleotide amidase